jgi:hypothetical protein
MSRLPRLSRILCIAFFLGVAIGPTLAHGQDEPLTLSATATPDPVRPGGEITFMFTITNRSGEEVSGVELQTTVPAHVESFPGESDDASGYFCNEGFSGTTCDPGEVMKWEFDTLPDGQSQSATFSAQLLSGSSAPPENTAISTGATFTADGVGGGGTTASVLASTASYQIQETADGRFRTSLNEEDSTYAVTVQLKADPGESDLGTSTVRVGYNQLALEYNTVSFSNYDGTQLSFTGGTVTYSSNVTQPDPGVIALNITKESSTDGNGQAPTNEWTDVATLTFDIMDRSAMSRLNWPEQDIYNRLGEPDGEYQRGTFTESNETLPVELARLTADVSRSAVRLEWQTASEQNNAGFEVQRKEESGWNQMGFVESKADGGTTTEAQSYRFTAEDLPIGTHQFRLKQVDLDGSSQVHGPISVDVQMQEAIRLTAPAPNPVSSTATLSFAVKEEAQAIVAVYDLLGRKAATLFEGTPTPGESTPLRLDASTLPSGAYLLRLRAAGRTETQRVTVLR